MWIVETLILILKVRINPLLFFVPVYIEVVAVSFILESHSIIISLAKRRFSLMHAVICVVVSIRQLAGTVVERIIWLPSIPILLDLLLSNSPSYYWSIECLSHWIFRILIELSHYHYVIINGFLLVYYVYCLLVWWSDLEVLII